jgi:uncharacterized protein
MKQLFLRDKDKHLLEQLIKRYLPNITVWAYGSRVKGDAHETSDLDIVLRSEDLSAIPHDIFKTFVEAVRESNIPILVDARDWAKLPISFHNEILKYHIEL